MASLSQIFAQDRYVTLHALEAGSLTLPATQFLSPCEPNLRLTKPSLSFLIQHQDETGHLTRIIFDLGIRRNTEEYPEPLRKHLLSRQPLTSFPDVTESIKLGGLTADDINLVILSHAHWDHVGTPKDFRQSIFVVGHGTLELLQDSTVSDHKAASHSHFEADLLPLDRTVELSAPSRTETSNSASAVSNPVGARLAQARWNELLHFEASIDVFGDQSLFIIDAPGHLSGHINLLARIGPKMWVYLAGDACHDRRLLTGELDTAEWTNEHGALCCIHSNKDQARETMRRIRELEIQYGAEIEVILAHDEEWYAAPANHGRFWPGRL